MCVHGWAGVINNSTHEDRLIYRDEQEENSSDDVTSHTVVGVWQDIEEVWSHTHMVSIGATRSSDAIRTPASESSTVSIRAKLGSPFKPVCLKKLRKKRRLSLAMAWRRRGAPVKDCSPTPPQGGEERAQEDDPSGRPCQQ